MRLFGPGFADRDAPRSGNATRYDFVHYLTIIARAAAWTAARR